MRCRLTAGCRRPRRSSARSTIRPAKRANNEINRSGYPRIVGSEIRRQMMLQFEEQAALGSGQGAARTTAPVHAAAAEDAALRRVNVVDKRVINGQTDVNQ